MVVRTWGWGPSRNGGAGGASKGNRAANPLVAWGYMLNVLPGTRAAQHDTGPHPRNQARGRSNLRRQRTFRRSVDRRQAARPQLHFALAARQRAQPRGVAEEGG